MLRKGLGAAALCTAAGACILLAFVDGGESTAAQYSRASSHRKDIPYKEREAEEFRIVYSHMPLVDLEEEFALLQQRLDEMTNDAFNEFHAAGRYEVIGNGDQMRITSSDTRGLVTRFMIDGSTKEHRKIVLPEASYPEAYAVRRRSEWVWLEIQRRKRHQKRDG